VANVPRITLLGRPGCHLCDDARAVIERVAGELGVGWDERDITASPADMQEYWDKIPVTLVDGVQIDFWRVSETRLRAALSQSLGQSPDRPPGAGPGYR
jgi:glutaredoxin